MHIVWKFYIVKLDIPLSFLQWIHDAIGVCFRVVYPPYHRLPQVSEQKEEGKVHVPMRNHTNYQWIDKRDLFLFIFENTPFFSNPTPTQPTDRQVNRPQAYTHAITVHNSVIIQLFTDSYDSIFHEIIVVVDRARRAEVYPHFPKSEGSQD